MFGARGQDGQVVEGPFQGRGWASRSHLRGFVPSILNKLCRVLVFVVGDSLQGSQRVSRIMHSSRLRLTYGLYQVHLANGRLMATFRSPCGQQRGCTDAAMLRAERWKRKSHVCAQLVQGSTLNSLSLPAKKSVTAMFPNRVDRIVVPCNLESRPFSKFSSCLGVLTM